MRPTNSSIGALIAGTMILVLSSPARAQCPESTLKFPPVDSGQNTAAPTFDATGTEGSWIRGDHRIGEYKLHHSGLLSPTFVVSRDRFDVTGVPPGTPVNVTLRLRIDGWAYTDGCSGSGCCGILVATARAGPDSAQDTMFGNTFRGRADFGATVELPITLTSGSPRDLEVELWGRRCPGGAHTVDAIGRVTFEGLDPNAVVVSCKGFGPAPVPVQRRTWGEIKTIYR